MSDTTSLPVPPPPDQFALTVALNKALFAHAAVKSQSAILAQEENKLKLAVAELEILMKASGDLRSVGSALGAAVIVPKVVYNAADWVPLHNHIQRTGEFDLLHRRINQTAARDRASNHDLPPGMQEVTLYETKLSLI